jgi:hypothetical protein
MDPRIGRPPPEGARVAYAQIAFSHRFGSLEVTRSMNPAAGTPFARQSNLDALKATGKL